MRGRVWTCALVLMSVALVAGCQPTVRGTSCALDDECAINQACIENDCQVVECRDDSNCDPNEQCVDYACEPTGACGSDGQCPAGQICEEGACVPGCRTDGDCPTGQICEDQTCRAGCRENGDCPDGPCDPQTWTCAGQTCAQDLDCEPGQICVDQACTPGCNGDEDCSAGQLCDPATSPNGACVDCLTDPDCLDPLAPVCLAGVCGAECDQDGDCPAEQVCVDHRCEEPVPQCDLQIAPADPVDFGSLPEGGIGLVTFSLVNSGTGACQISEVLLLESIGPQPQFHLVEAPALPVVLAPAGQPSDRLTVQVAYTPSAPGVHRATFWVHSDDPDLAVGSDEPTCQLGGPWIAGQACVPLQGSAVPACESLVALPLGVDFGAVSLGCNSSQRRVRIYNLANGPRGVADIYLDPPASDAFQIVWAPVVPVVLQSGENLEVILQYTPQSVGLAAATLRVVPDQANCEQGVPLFGFGTDSADSFDAFSLPDVAMVDVLWVIDNSSSMSAVQTALAQHFTEFLRWALQVGVDFHVGVVTTDMEDPDQAGRLQGDPLFITPQTQDPEEAFAANVQVGIDGSPIEMGLATSLSALTDPLASGHNAGFSRIDARLAVIWVSDENDQSPYGLDLYFDFFQALKGSLDKLALSAVCGDVPDGCEAPDGTPAEAGRRYLGLVDMSQGMFQSICSPDWNSLMQQLGLFAFSPQRNFWLARPAVAGPIEVWVDGQPVIEAPMEFGVNGWTLVADGAAIWFGDNVLPAFGSTVEVAYQAACQ